MSETGAPHRVAVTRRQFLQMTGRVGLGGLVAARVLTGYAAEKMVLPFANGARSLVTFPQKRQLILLTARPPQLETPFSVFNEGVITPNDAFFVRYHLSQVPTSIDPEKFTLSVKGRVNSVSKFSLAELKKFNPLE